MTLVRILLAAMLAAYGLAAQAQVLPKPKEFYFDDDKRARPIVVVEGQGDAMVEQLIRARDSGRRKGEAAAQLAHLAMAGGRLDLGKELYRKVIAGAQSDGGLWRAIKWNYAWDLYRAGEYAPAFSEWAPLVGGVGGPSWLPPTLALSLWSVDRKAEAVQWYAAAVRTEPLLWGDPSNFPRLLPGWREEDRAKLAEVQAAWQAKPPSWP